MRLISEAIAKFKLDLTGLTILTEAASGAYVCSPIIAAASGASRVIALTSDSMYGSIDQVRTITRELASFCGVWDRIEVTSERSPDVIGSADIVTNLGFVRPIDDHFVSCMKQGAVISLMCEAWEMRGEDIDTNACTRRGIPLVATNESLAGSEIFDYVGFLTAKLLFELGVEVRNSNVLIVGTDKFSHVIADCLSHMGANVEIMEKLMPRPVANGICVDAVVVADYSRKGTLIGPGGDMEASEFAQNFPSAVLVPLAGKLDASALMFEGVEMRPNQGHFSPRRMSVTLGYLGARPIVDLHTAGLRVGEWAFRIKMVGLDPTLPETIRTFPLAQAVVTEER